MTIGSLLVAAGAVGRWDSPLLIAGGVLMLIGFAISLRALSRTRREQPLPSPARWAVAGVVAFYLAVAAVAALAAGAHYGVAALAAGIVPLAATFLVIATMVRTVEADADFRPAPRPRG